MASRSIWRSTNNPLPALETHTPKSCLVVLGNIWGLWTLSQTTGSFRMDKNKTFWLQCIEPGDENPAHLVSEVLELQSLDPYSCLEEGFWAKSRFIKENRCTWSAGMTHNISENVISLKIEEYIWTFVLYTGVWCSSVLTQRPRYKLNFR